MDDLTDQLRQWSTSLAHAVEPADIDGIKSPTTQTDTPNHNRRWLAVAASIVVIGAGIFAVATLGSDDSDQVVPATTPPQGSVDTTTATTQTTSPPTTASPTTTPPTAAPVAGPSAISVPLNATVALPLQPITTVEYGPGDEQIEVADVELPPPAVWYVSGVLVLEDAPETGLTGDGVIVQTGPDSAFQDGAERRFVPVTIDVAEPGGSPIAVRSLDGGGIVVVTAHDTQPAIRIRQYSQNSPGVFAEFGVGADRDGLGDSELRITANGATWGGEVVIPPGGVNPAAVRPIVTIDPEFGPSSSFEIQRPAQDGTPATSWILDVDIDQEFPPGTGGPRVEPFGDGALVIIRNSNSQSAEPVVVVLGADGDGIAYDLNGWSISDVRPDGALLTRSTPDGLELAWLAPTS